MVNQLPSASYSRSVCEIGGKGTEACQIDQGGWTGEVTRQRVLVQWRNKEGGQGVSARGWEGQDLFPSPCQGTKCPFACVRSLEERRKRESKNKQRITAATVG